MRKRCFAVLAVFLVLSLCACSAPTAKRGTVVTEATSASEATVPPTTEPAASEPDNGEVWPTYRVEASELPLAIDIPEGCRLQINDAQAEHILYTLQQSVLDEERMLSYDLTKAVGIYDTASGTVTAQWEPAEAGWYFTGALSGAQAAVFARIDDYENAVPAHYSIVSFRAEAQTTLQSITGAVQQMQHLGETALFSYYDADGRFGVRSVSPEDATDDVLLWQAKGKTVTPLAGDLSAFEGRFAYTCVQDGRCALITADLSGEQSRVSLEYLTERLDHFCLTPQGLLASLSLEEDTADAHHELTLFASDGTRYRTKSYRPLYRMAFSSTLGCAVDSFYHVFVIAASRGRVLYRPFSPDLPEEMQSLLGQPLAILRGDDTFLYFYFTELQRLFLVRIAPAA